MTIGPSTTYARLRDTLDNITLIPSGNAPFTGSDKTEMARVTQDQWEAIKEAVSRCQDRIDEGADEAEARIIAHNLALARRTLFNALLNQVGVDEDVAKESVETLEARFRAAGERDEAVTTKLLLEATRYLDM